MKPDTQHLDYLLSQYVDGCLDPNSKKSLEQKLVNDPQARKLYKDQHDVQEMLEDWGNRIPMINWTQFDKELAGRLEHETVGGQKVSIFRRWSKPAAIAAGLFLAATIGYSWHALSSPANLVNTGPGPVAASQDHRTSVTIDDHVANKTPAYRGVTINEDVGLRGPTTDPAVVQITAPDASTPGDTGANTFRFGMDNNIPGAANAKPATPKNSTGSDADPALPLPAIR